MECLVRSTAPTSHCEWKGAAHYYDLVVNEQRVQQVAWAYANPHRHFAPITDYLAFYPARVEACYVDGERVQPQPGEFYGGWITSDVVGPFKGAPGSWGW